MQALELALLPAFIVIAERHVAKDKGGKGVDGGKTGRTSPCLS